MRKTELPFGTWPSPVSADMTAGKSRRFGMLCSDAGTLYWSESRPEEQGRCVIMRADADGGAEEVLPSPWSARSKVHEYGGGEFLVSGGILYFVEALSQDIYFMREGVDPRALTHVEDTRFADMELDAARARLIAVAERQPMGGDHAHPENFLALIPVDGGITEDIQPLTGGHDFYASPRLSPDGETLAFLAWDLPHMPWEAAALYIIPLCGEGAPGDARRIAGGEGSAVFQPEWNDAGELVFVWDESGWGNVYVWDSGKIRSITHFESELSRPQWAFGIRSYAQLSDGKIAALFLEDGAPRLHFIAPETGKSDVHETRLREISSIVSSGNDLGVIGASDTQAPSILCLGSDDGEVRLLRAGMDVELENHDISVGQTLKVTSQAGEDIFALYYPPANASYSGPAGELPPVIVTVHGGPTGQADRGFKTKTQFWTSRGFGVCDIDYSGSAGYGRDYRKRLDGQWGMRDVEDVEAVVRCLVARELADPDRLVISGGSAGGYTVLMALANLDVFAAGGCSYAVCDLARLQQITHKFEAGYLYGLTGTTAQNCGDVFAARSPVNLAGAISAPVIFFQGTDDKVVPPEQSRAMAQTLKSNRLRVAYHEFAGEGHGFRQAETVREVLELECSFYREVLDLHSTA